MGRSVVQGCWARREPDREAVLVEQYATMEMFSALPPSGFPIAHRPASISDETEIQP